MAVTLLSREEHLEYVALMTTLQAPELKSARGLSLLAFRRIIVHLLAFCSVAKAGAWKRCLVCGISPMPDGLAVHTKRLTEILGRSKSAVNARLSAMGFEAKALTSQDYRELACRLNNPNQAQLRNRTVRKTKEAKQQSTHPECSTADDDIAQMASQGMMISDGEEWTYLL
jgi:hypothetical protein